MFEPLHNETQENRQTVVSDVFTRGGWRIVPNGAHGDVVLGETKHILY